MQRFTTPLLFHPRGVTSECLNYPFPATRFHPVLDRATTPSLLIVIALLDIVHAR